MRKSARNQPLPIEEVAVLRSLKGIKLKARCRALYDAGWTLSAIGEPLGKQRSTIRLWVNSVEPSTGGFSIPLPIDKTYVPKKTPSPGISAVDRQRITELAPLARKYRSKLPDTHPSSKANYELTALCMSLHSQHVTIQELADAAGVTYRAMYRRIKHNGFS
jgi:DNA-binding NtrC family response regulator